MTVYVYRPKHPNADENGMVPLSVANADENRRGPYVISDSMQPLKHMGTGRVLDSKSDFRKETRNAGCVEIGNEQSKPRSPITLDRGARRDAIRKALYYHRNG